MKTHPPQPAVTCVQLLIAAGAGVHTANKQDATAVHLAAVHGRAHVLLQLKAASADLSRAMGANLGALHPRGGLWGFTPLHLAALQGHAAAAQQLLLSGAAPNANTAGK
jgi:ankyrin repeat protein